MQVSENRPAHWCQQQQHVASLPPTAPACPVSCPPAAVPPALPAARASALPSLVWQPRSPRPLSLGCTPARPRRRQSPRLRGVLIARAVRDNSQTSRTIAHGLKTEPWAWAWAGAGINLPRHLAATGPCTTPTTAQLTGDVSLGLDPRVGHLLAVRHPDALDDAALSHSTRKHPALVGWLVGRLVSCWTSADSTWLMLLWPDTNLTSCKARKRLQCASGRHRFGGRRRT